MATIARFEDMISWQKARLLNDELRIAFKPCRDYSFTDQLFRASVSIMNNIAEGFERGSDKEFSQFLNYAKGSAGEVRSMLYLANDQGYLPDERSAELRADCERISKLIAGFMQKLKAIH